MPDALPIILILGPTAGGKTELAIRLAESLPGGGECICADSMQIYRHMDIGTAKPTEAERARVPHHLFDLIEPDEDGFTVDTWLDRAEKCIEAIRGRDRWPIVVGGTNLYAQALLHGLFDGPDPDPALRKKLEGESLPDLRAKLELIDPEAASRIHPNDRKRTVRAIEVFEQTGTPISQWQSQWERGTIRDDVFIIGLDYPAEVINRRINARVKRMIEAGLIDEVRSLYESGYKSGHKSGRLGRQAAEALGYKQIIAALEGEMSLDEAVEQIKIRTRRYAKQQRTWLRRFRAHPKAIWLDASDQSPEELAKAATSSILQNVESPQAYFKREESD
ncbi:MAG: tRNA (adenosine(37)-N6)-dimethylallyltransferase MiaA [Phycisphaerales bacterium]|nr:MAG: tRNA (adenosine(37)-N6)-dimethylallyltransferase MiaA [Phycisphaerales bacterium]